MTAFGRIGGVRSVEAAGYGLVCGRRSPRRACGLHALRKRFWCFEVLVGLAGVLVKL